MKRYDVFRMMSLIIQCFIVATWIAFMLYGLWAFRGLNQHG